MSKVTKSPNPDHPYELMFHGHVDGFMTFENSTDENGMNLMPFIKTRASKTIDFALHHFDECRSRGDQIYFWATKAIVDGDYMISYAHITSDTVTAPPLSFTAVGAVE